MSIYDKASLVLIPSGSKTSKVYSQKPTNGDGDFTFSRSTAATRVNASGNIEKETQNLFKYSNAFTTSPWAGSATWTSGQADKDGGTDAWLIQKSGATNSDYYSDYFSGVHTFSIYVKKEASKGIAIYNFNSGGTATAIWNIETGTKISQNSYVIDSHLVAYNSNWWRFDMSVNVTSGRWFIYATDGTSTLTTDTLVIQDAQLEQGLVARDYIETTTTAIYGGITDNVPRLDYTDSSCPALLLEPQRTNAMTFSEGLNIGLGINYKSSGVTLTPNDAESPEGYNNATKFDGGLNDIADTYTGYTASTTNTFSAFLKAGTCDIAKMRHTATGSTAEITINLTSGTITNTTGAQYLDSSIVDYGNGWYRASITFTSGTTAYITRVQLGEAGYIHMYGWQIERGASYATSYIPTYGSSVTRTADVSKVFNAADLIGQSEGTMFADFYLTELSLENRFILVISNNNQSEAIFLRHRNNNSLQVYSAGLADNFDIRHSISTAGNYKIAVGYKSGDIVFYVNGTQISTDASAYGTLDMLKVFLGTQISTGFELGGGINQALLFKTRLSNEELADLTTL